MGPSGALLEGAAQDSEMGRPVGGPVRPPNGRLARQTRTRHPPQCVREAEVASIIYLWRCGAGQGAGRSAGAGGSMRMGCRGEGCTDAEGAEHVCMYLPEQDGDGLHTVRRGGRCLGGHLGNNSRPCAAHVLPAAATLLTTLHTYTSTLSPTPACGALGPRLRLRHTRSTASVGGILAPGGVQRAARAGRSKRAPRPGVQDQGR